MFFQRLQRYGQKLMGGSQKIIEGVLDYLVWLQTPNESFNGIPVCPFIKGDFETDNIKFSVYSKRDKKSLIEHITEYVDSGKRSGLIVQFDPIRTTRRRYQKFVNTLLKENGFGDYKIILIDPNEEWEIAGIETRKMAPCVLINISEKKEFGKASKQLKESKYYDSFLMEDFKKLKIKKHKRVLNENS